MFDGIQAVTDLVQRTHTEASNRWTDRAGMVAPVEPLARSVNALQLAGAAVNYASIREVSRGVGVALAALTDPFLEGDDELATPLSGDALGTLPWWLDHAEGALNGFLGDHLARRGNSLDLGMSLRHQGKVVRPEELGTVEPNATGKVVVFVHGLSATEWSWVLYADRVWGDPATCYGTKLREDLGFTPLFVRYNTGRHVSDSGGALAQLLEDVCAHYPAEIEEIALVGHSMGGLVVRSAAHHGASSPWLRHLRHVFCLGAPHLGAPLEKGAHLLGAVLGNIPAAAASVSAAVLGARSDGIKDLRHGYTTSDEWRGEDPRALLHDNRHDIPLVDGVGYYALAAAFTADPQHAAGQLFGDWLVRVPSASGEAARPERRIPFHSKRVFPGMNHLQLANHPAVYDTVRARLEG